MLLDLVFTWPKTVIRNITHYAGLITNKVSSMFKVMGQATKDFKAKYWDENYGLFNAKQHKK